LEPRTQMRGFFMPYRLPLVEFNSKRIGIVTLCVETIVYPTLLFLSLGMFSDYQILLAKEKGEAENL